MAISMSLALQPLLGREKKSAGKLHGQRGSALRLLSGAHVLEHGHHQAVVVHAAVFEESPIFNCQHRLDQVLRNFVVGDQPSLGSIDVF